MQLQNSQMRLQPFEIGGGWGGRRVRGEVLGAFEEEGHEVEDGPEDDAIDEGEGLANMRRGRRVGFLRRWLSRGREGGRRGRGLRGGRVRQEDQTHMTLGTED